MEREPTQEHIAFIDALVRLGKVLAELFRMRNPALFPEMNAAIKEMYRVQHGSDDAVFRELDPDCEIVYKNFDMIVAVLRTTEGGEVDSGAQTAVNKCLHNINAAAVGLAARLGIV